MLVTDLIKATLVCGGLAFVFYSFPVVSQAMTIALLTLLWISYAYHTVARLRHR